MPRGMTIPEWRALVYAANKSWFGYVLPAWWIWVMVLGAAFLLWVDATTLLWMQAIHLQGYDHGHPLKPLHPIQGKWLAQAVAWLTGFRVLFRTIDWLGKRKLARRIGLLPAAPPSSGV